MPLIHCPPRFAAVGCPPLTLFGRLPDSGALLRGKLGLVLSPQGPGSASPSNYSVAAYPPIRQLQRWEKAGVRHSYVQFRGGGFPGRRWSYLTICRSESSLSFLLLGPHRHGGRGPALNLGHASRCVSCPCLCPCGAFPFLHTALLPIVSGRYVGMIFKPCVVSSGSLVRLLTGDICSWQSCSDGVS